jgi:hypothetical protein
MEVFANSLENDSQESGDDASLSETATAALQLALERNAVRLRRVEYESRELLITARALLLAREPKTMLPVHNPSGFPWRRLVPELQHYILRFLHATLSDAQHTRVCNYASNTASLPVLFTSYVNNPRSRQEWIEDYLLAVGCNRFEGRPA